MYKVTMAAARVNAGYSQAQAGELIGVGRQTVLNWENGISTIDVPHFKKMCEVYKVPEKCIILPKKSTLSGRK